MRVPTRRFSVLVACLLTVAGVSLVGLQSVSADSVSTSLIGQTAVPDQIMTLGTTSYSSTFGGVIVTDNETHLDESAWEFRRLSRLGERMESWKRSELDIRGIRLS